jgi:predicted  nucleic acid-binding Zn-ribbon protein
MTETKTDTESVERFAAAVELQTAFEDAGPYSRSLLESATTLRALSAERDRLRHELEASEALVADLREKLDEAGRALKTTRDKLESACRSEFEGVWQETDFANETNEADTFLTKMEGRKDG